MTGTRQLTRGAFFIALGIVIPFAFHAIGGPGLGRVFLPMHVPVLLAGFLCGPVIGLITGMLTPILSAVFTGMPPLMPPMAQTMVVELGIYGAVAGLMYQRTKLGPLLSLIGAMAAGRLAYGLVGWLVLPLFGLTGISPLYPLTYGVATALPGVAIQLVVIPLTVHLVGRKTAVAGTV